MGTENPLVSICIPTYNGESFLNQALASVQHQTYGNIEIIVSDDGSTDRTLEIVEKFKVKSPYEFSVYHHSHSTIGANWNNCIKYSKGQYIKFLFQDDILEPNCIEELLKPFLQNRKVGLSFCKRNFIYDNKNDNHTSWVNKFKDIHLEWFSIGNIVNGRKLLQDKNLLAQPRNKIGEPTAVLLNKEVFRKIGNFNGTLKQALDYEFWHRVLIHFDIAFVDKYLVSFRLHDKQATAVNAKQNIVDYDLYPLLMYRNCFWYLHNDLKKELFIRFNIIGKIYTKVKRKCRRFLPL